MPGDNVRQRGGARSRRAIVPPPPPPPAPSRVNSQLLRWVMVGLTVVGLGIVTYLTVVHYAGIKVLCASGKTNSCEQVQTSVYSRLAGIPIVDLGLIGYVGILAGLLAPDIEWTRLGVLAFTVVGFGFSLYLTYREAFSLHEYCEWCLGSAGIMTVLVILASIRYVVGPSQPPDSPGK